MNTSLASKTCIFGGSWAGAQLHSNPTPAFGHGTDDDDDDDEQSAVDFVASLHFKESFLQAFSLVLAKFMTFVTFRKVEISFGLRSNCILLSDVSKERMENKRKNCKKNTNKSTGFIQYCEFY